MMPIVKHLYLKQARKAAMSVAERVELTRGVGIVGDINANGRSPRQVLVLNNDDLLPWAIPPAQMRGNTVLDGVSCEDFQPGAKLTFSSGGAIRLTFYCEPCKRVAHLVDSLKSIEYKRGILGVVVANGAIAIGDRVKLEANYYPALSEIPYERYLDFIEQIPLGKVVTYKQILEAIGVDRSYFRVLPLYIRKTPPGYPIHRILDSKGQIIAHIPQQQQLLAAEGVKFERDLVTISLEEYAWQNLALPT